MTKQEENIYDTLVEMKIATIEELNLVRNLMDGSWTEILNAVLYVRTGYRTIEQMFEEENEEDEKA